MRPLLPALCSAQGQIKRLLIHQPLLTLRRRLSVSSQSYLGSQTESILSNRAKSQSILARREMSQLMYNDKVAIVTGAGGGTVNHPIYKHNHYYYSRIGEDLCLIASQQRGKSCGQ